MSDLDTALKPAIAKKIQFLVDAQFQWLNFKTDKEKEEYQSSITKFRDQLLSRSEVELDEFYRKEAEIKDAKDRLRTANETDAKLNLNFFNPDLKHWARMDYWERKQAASLAHGKDPSELDLDDYSEVKGSKVLQGIRQLNSILSTTYLLDHGGHPTRYIRFFEEKEITFPAKLKEYVEKYHPQKAEAPKIKENGKPPVTDTKPIHAKERESLEKLILGLAIGAYGLDAITTGEVKAPEIRGDLISNAGLDMDDDTIRKHLRASLKHLNLDEQK